MPLRMLVAEGCRPTGVILSNLLREQGITMERGEQIPTGVVCWGQGTDGTAVPALNANASRHDKLAQFRLMREGDVNVPDFVPARPPYPIAIGNPEVFTPWLGRKLRHHGGTDISIVLEPADFLYRAGSGSEFFTKYIPSIAEYRVWIYRRKHLGTYVKHLAHPEMYRGIGRNFDNGFAFNLVNSEAIPRDAVEQASRAVSSLGLDFGAVDLLYARNGRYYVLEVNTAPGVEGENRQVIQALARKIARWVALGYPRRAGTGGRNE